MKRLNISIDRVRRLYNENNNELIESGNFPIGISYTSEGIKYTTKLCDYFIRNGIVYEKLNEKELRQMKLDSL